jgi:hypothetical protein
MEYKIKPSACLVFFGIRFLSVEPVDTKSDPRAQAAEQHGLSAWAGRRYPPVEPAQPAYYLLIGKWLRSVGYDGSCERSVPITDLRQAATATAKKLAQAGFTEAPELWIQCKFD